MKNLLRGKPLSFYKILVFPYVIDKRVEGHTKLSKEEAITKRWDDIPKNHESIWEEVAEGVRIRKKLVDINQNRLKANS